AAVLRPHRKRNGRRAHGARPRVSRGGRPRSGRQPRTLLARIAREASRDPQAAPAESGAPAAGLVLHADLHPRPAGAGVRLARWRRDGRARAVWIAYGGGPLRTLRGARSLSRRTGGRVEFLASAAARTRAPVPDRRAVDRLARRV